MSYADQTLTNLVLQELGIGGDREDELSSDQFTEAAGFVDTFIDSVLSACYVVPLNQVGGSYPQVIVGLANRLVAARLTLEHFSQTRPDARAAAVELWNRSYGELLNFVQDPCGPFVIPYQRRHTRRISLNPSTAVTRPPGTPGAMGVPTGG